jgi:hypothetical protein
VFYSYTEVIVNLSVYDLKTTGITMHSVYIFFLSVFLNRPLLPWGVEGFLLVNL